MPIRGVERTWLLAILCHELTKIMPFYENVKFFFRPSF